MVKSEKSTATDQSKFRLKVDPIKWSDVEPENTIDLSGKRLHLFQLPPNMPVSCLDGVELAVPKKNKWSKSVRLNYTSNKGKDNSQLHTVELKAQRMKSKDTLMEVRDGKLVACDNQPISLFQGFEVLESSEVVVPEPTESVHQIPEGLRQRFTPIGNIVKPPLVDISEAIAAAKTPVAKGRQKRKSTNLLKGQQNRANRPAALDSPGNNRDITKYMKTNSPKKVKRNRDTSDEDSDAAIVLPIKKSKKSLKTPSSAEGQTLTPKKPKKKA